MLKVVAGFIKKGDKILLAKRATGDENVRGKWEFPGGKVEKGESEADAIKREIAEEFEINISVNEYISHFVFKNVKQVIDLRLYDCNYVSGDIELHDHEDYRWLKFEEIEDFDLAPADRQLLELVKMKKRISNLKINDVLTNKDINEIFKCSTSGGMNKSLKTNSLVLFAKHNDDSYTDTWTEDGILNYCGMGLVGDQDVNYRYNKDLANSNYTDIKVYLFESYVENEYYYRGEVYLCGEIFEDVAPDKNGNIRKVYKFPLKCKSDYHTFIVNEDSIFKHKKEVIKQVKKLSKDKLKNEAKSRTNVRKAEQIIVNNRYRDEYIAEYTKVRAKGKCDLCEEYGPFQKKNGEYYLEEHHVITLADGGPDAIYNTVALCPNCHRKVHILKHRKDFNKLKNKIYIYLSEDNDIENIEKFEKLFR